MISNECTQESIDVFEKYRNQFKYNVLNIHQSARALILRHGGVRWVQTERSLEMQAK